MAKGDHGHKGSGHDEAAKDGPRARALEAAAKADRKRARRVVKVESQLADAREIRAAVDVLIDSLERKLADLNGVPATPAGKSASTSQTAATAPAPRRPRKPGPPA